MNSPPPLRSGLLQAVVALCRLRGGPQDLPHSPNLLALLIVAGTVLDVVAGSVLGDTDDVLPRSLLSTVVVLGLCWLALTIRHLQNRYVQTATALLACTLLFSLLQLPLALLAGPPPAHADALTAAQWLLGWATLALFVWQLVVYAQIMRHAIEASFALAFALVASWVIADWALERLLFGTAA